MNKLAFKEGWQGANKPAHSGRYKSDLLPQLLTEILDHFPFKNFHEQAKSSGFWDTSLPSPQVAGLLNKAKFSFPTNTYLSRISFQE